MNFPAAFLTFSFGSRHIQHQRIYKFSFSFEFMHISVLYLCFTSTMILRLETYANFTKHTCFLFLLRNLPVEVWQVFHYLASMRSVKYTPPSPRLHLGVRSLRCRGETKLQFALKTQVRLRGCWQMIIQTRLRS